MAKFDPDGVSKFGANADIDIAAAEDVWDGGGIYAFPTAARIHNIKSTDPQDSGFAVGILTLSANVSDGDTVTIDSKVYTFQDTLTDVDGNVHIGASASDSIDNLIAAITLGAGAGTDYATSMTLHPTATAGAGAGDTMAAYAKTSGTGGETIATTETSATASWGAATMALGTGARTMEIQGLDSAFLEITETVTLNGLINVASSKSYLRINTMIVKTGGTDGKNDGIITATAVTDATVTAQIAIGNSRTTQAIFTVPANADLSMNYYYIGVGKTTSGRADGSLLIRQLGQVFHTKHVVSAAANEENKHEFEPPIIVPAKSDIKIQASVATDNMSIFAGFEANFSRPALAV